MDFEVSKSLVTTLVPLLEYHNGIGLIIVGVFMYLRSDSVLKMFGVGVALLGLGQMTTGTVVWLQPTEESLQWFGIVGGFAGLVAVIVFFIVGSSDYAPRWRRLTLYGVLVWGIVLIALELALDSGNVQKYTEAGYVYSNLHAITQVWFMVGWFIAFLEAVHITVKHSHGEPYRSILVAAMSIFAVSVMVVVVAGENDSLRIVNSVVSSAIVLAMWVAVVLHERKEIASDRQVDRG